MVNILVLVLCLSGISFLLVCNFKCSTRKRKKLNLVLVLALSLCLCLRQGRFQGEIRIIVPALELASLVKTFSLNK